MNLYKFIALPVLIICVFVSTSAAQNASAGPTFVPETDLSKVSKRYSGVIQVWVSYNAEGSVTDVNALYGPGWYCPSAPDVAQLHAVAEQAARGAKFEASEKGGTGVVEFPLGLVNEGPPKVEAGDRATADLPRYTAAPVPGAPAITQPVDGKVMVGKAKLLPAPEYPAAAKAIKLSGMVQTQLMIDEEGRVTMAVPVSGHNMLRRAAAYAACRAEFTPTLVEGNPVKIQGTITYNFTL